jgi:hypothetical protein
MEYGVKTVLRLLKWFAIVLGAFVLAACGSPTPPQAATSTETVTVVPSSSAAPSLPPPAAPTAGAAAPVVSKLINVTLPPGTVPDSGGSMANTETWLVTTPYDYTVQNLRQQLPINHDYDGMPWCSEDINRKVGTTQWYWADDKGSIMVNVSDRGQVIVSRGPDDWGRSMCSSP